MISNCLCLKT